MDLEPEAVADFFEEACGTDEELFAEVQSLWAGSGIEHVSVDQPAIPRYTFEAGSLKGKSIGPYRLIEELGSGGMGVVYLGRREEEFEQRVAIKLIRPDKAQLAGAEILGRFHRERQILANLEHPNIARLLDGGTTDGGIPYLVMEFVTGQPLKKYVEGHGLSIPGVLRLFIDVCEAVGFAHRNLVVHRDLKHANILVTASGVVKLLDFGIAKILADGEASADQTETVELRRVTPGYASPEQLEGRPVTTSSDIYSLGVVLYELLAGTTLFGKDSPVGKNHDREVLPPAPSTVGATLGRRISKDLDAIVLKALRPEVGERYGSVEQLVADLERFLEGRPVLAHKGSTSYRVSKFVRRHRTRIAVGGLVTALSLGGLVATVNERQERQRQSDLRELEADLTRQLTRYLKDILRAADPSLTGEAVPQSMLNLLAEGRTQAGTLEERPLFQASLLETIGVTYRRLGEYAEAEAVLRESLELRLSQLDESSYRVGNSWTNLALALREVGKYSEAAMLAEKALANHRAAYSKENRTIAADLANLAGCLKELGKRDEAVELYRESLELRERLIEGDSRSLVLALNNLGRGLHDAGRLDEAAEYYRRAADMAMRLTKKLKGRELRGLETTMATVLRNRGDWDIAMGDLQGATWKLGESLKILERAYPPGHRRLAQVELVQAKLAVAEGRLDEAEALVRGVVASFIEAFDDKSHPKVASARRQLAEILWSRGQRSEAETEARIALQILTSTLPADHWEVAETEALLVRIRS